VIDVVFVLGRLPFDTRLTYGNGPLWVMVAIGIWTLTKAAPERRANLLKGVGLGFALIIGTKAGDAYLLITTKTKPLVLDQFVLTADHALGQPSWIVGRLLESSGRAVELLIQTIYIELPVAAMALAIWQIRNGWPRHTFAKTFLLIAAVGPVFYLVFPVVGPIFAYGDLGGAHALADLWPNTVPARQVPVAFPFDELTPRNCMPSLHTAWSLAIFIHTRREVPVVRWAGTIWFVGTLIATLGFGWHYGVDLVAGVVFALTIETALRAPERGWDRARIGQLVLGVVVFAAMLWSYRFLAEPMADHPWVAGPLLLAAMALVVAGFFRQFFGPWNRWAPGDALAGTGTGAVVPPGSTASPSAAATTGRG